MAKKEKGGIQCLLFQNPLCHSMNSLFEPSTKPFFGLPSPSFPVKIKPQIFTGRGCRAGNLLHRLGKVGRSLHPSKPRRLAGHHPENVVKNMLREEQHWAEHLLQLPADITQPSPGADLELEGIVPPEDFLLLKRLYLYGETYEEVCQDLGIKKSALAMRVKRIKEQFRKNYMEIEKNFSSNSEQTAPTRHNTNRGGSKK